MPKIAVHAISETLMTGKFRRLCLSGVLVDGDPRFPCRHFRPCTCGFHQFRRRDCVCEGREVVDFCGRLHILVLEDMTASPLHPFLRTLVDPEKPPPGLDAGEDNSDAGRDYCDSAKKDSDAAIGGRDAVKEDRDQSNVGKEDSDAVEKGSGASKDDNDAVMEDSDAVKEGTGGVREENDAVMGDRDAVMGDSDVGRDGGVAVHEDGDAVMEDSVAADLKEGEMTG
eukprot:CAMPEP_0114606870 /NCGR_PEP_ID=MMETSP0168-20121206/1783_1 /TAXON_ID=95228 ORGANISM="Vannella sp., Strain DIVA3 517/6/12" /NCGR_SAMPLE_ID=MMETSP0168 /ASSEMBLY_ACC=CAM_ASM_000044 /LENGTH=225 /DNA_ID=CAMNT_0001817745 /DNA_START=62 /DNA_END=736 /DNA_ORIENTATION=-